MMNETLINFLNNSSTVCIPNGYNKAYPRESLLSEGFVPNNYYRLLKSFSDAKETFEHFKILAQAIVDQPYNPMYASSFLLAALRNIVGLSFVTEKLTDHELRHLLYAKLLANVNNGTINSTLVVYNTLMHSDYVQRIRLGFGTANVSYAAIGGKGLIISLTELQTFWQAAASGGIYIELRWGPREYLAFEEDSEGLGLLNVDDPLQIGGHLVTTILGEN